jgi:tetratricopeptide (TPR) repeat protein
MKSFTLASIFLLFLTTTHGQQTIQGRITQAGAPLHDVHVTNLDSGVQMASDQEGMYSIQARPKEELRFTYMGMDTVSVIVEDITRILNIKMSLRVEELEEVTVSKTILKGQKELELEYDSNPNIIKSAYGYLNKETSGYSIRIIAEDEIEKAANLDFAISGRFAGVSAGCSLTTDMLFASMRPSGISSGSLVGRPAPKSLSLSKGNPFANASNVVFDVDGMILNEISCGALRGNVRRIAFISSLAGLARYGRGITGVVVINTKTGTITPKESDGAPYDQARLRNNYLTEEVADVEGLGASLPHYLKELRGSGSTQAAKSVFENHKATYAHHPFFYLDSYRHFYETEKEKSYADGILNTYHNLAGNNPALLKAMAYVLEAQGQQEKAHSVYKQVYKLRPEYAQSFIDMANSYRDLDKPESAASLYARHSYLLDKGLLPKDSMELSAIMEREVDNLFALDNGSLKIKKRKKTDDENNTRLVFEWNDSEAEFNLQFVNPGNQYFEWKHTQGEMPERIRSEKELGYSMADFLLDEELLGDWKINATYHGNKQLTPTYLKVTVYRNYGSRLQSKEVHVFKLATKGMNQHLFKLRIPSEVVHH